MYATLLGSVVNRITVNVLVFGLRLHKGIELSNTFQMAIQSAVACS